MKNTLSKIKKKLLWNSHIFSNKMLNGNFKARFSDFVLITRASILERKVRSIIS